jgi:hypothetical protein
MAFAAQEVSSSLVGAELGDLVVFGICVALPEVTLPDVSSPVAVGHSHCVPL